MARLPRLSIAGLPHLVEQSGHNGQLVLTDATDRAAYRRLLGESAGQAGVAIHAYCLGATRVVLLATPERADSLSRMMQGLGRRYTSWFNRRHQRSGTVWSGRFRATVIDPEAEVVAAMRHVEADAALAGDAAAQLDEERVSSAAHHLGVIHDPLVSDHAAFWALGNTPFDRHAAYRRQVMQPLEPAQRARLDDAMRKGWALGSEAFLQSLARESPRRLAPSRPGRPKRTAATEG